MNKSFIFLATLAILLSFGGQVIAKAQKPSDDMILILIHHKSGPNDLDTKGLVMDKAKAFPSEKEKAEYEVYNIPYPKGVADYFGYSVYLHIQSGSYWIHQSGGVAGVSNFYGPGLVKDVPKP